MPTHNMECSLCHFQAPATRSPWSDDILCPSCGGLMVILWTLTPSTATVVHPSQRIVVWENPQTGEIRYPGRNDIPVPQRYQDLGFQRKELCTRREAEQFERDHNVVNEKLWYNTSTAPD